MSPIPQTGFLGPSPALSVGCLLLRDGVEAAEASVDVILDLGSCMLYCFQDNWGRIRKGPVPSQLGATEHPGLLAAFCPGK